MIALVPSILYTSDSLMPLGIHLLAFAWVKVGLQPVIADTIPIVPITFSTGNVILFTKDF